VGIKISKILYPTDFSEISLHALKYARELAGVFDAQLHCVHVVDEALQYWTAMGPESVPVGVAAEDLMSIAEGHMQRFADEHLVGLKFSPVAKVLVGRPFREIIVYARDNTIDLIVLTTHGRGGLSWVLMGSVAEKVVRKAPCPVLTVRHPEHEFVIP
jgi:nucleotide-binding universal stress UspA family protein